MDNDIELMLMSFGLAVYLICGSMLWIKRKQVPDRSRLFLSLFCFMMSIVVTMIIIGCYNDTVNLYDRGIMAPYLCIAGLYAISLFLFYPLEVIRPGALHGKWVVLILLPSLLMSLPYLFGMSFQVLTWTDFAEHWHDWDVLVRLLCIVFVTAFSLVMLIVPYNWRKSSADKEWIRLATGLILGIDILFYAHVFTSSAVFFYLHAIWIYAVILYFTYFELTIRVIPSDDIEEEILKAKSSEEITEQVDQSDGLWAKICHMMDSSETWRNPDTTIETLSEEIGTNRIYAARCIREHTGMAFNDYLNKKRVDYIASQLRENPLRDHKSLYFDVGYRSRQTAYRNFVKFEGCSPTEYAALS